MHRQLLQKKIFSYVLVAGMFAAFLALGTSSYIQENNTMDEDIHLMRGVLAWRTGSFLYNVYHPPLINMIAALPAALNPNFKIPDMNMDRPYYGVYAKMLALMLLWENKVDAEQILYSCRFMILVLGGFTGLLVYLWARTLYGPWAALTPAGLTFFCPNLMAHARLVTTDTGLTLFYFAAAYFLWRWLERKGSKLRWGLAALALGLAQLSKFSALVLYPAFFLTILADGFFEAEGRIERRFWQALRLACVSFLPMAAVSVLVIFAGYGFQPENYFTDIVKLLKKASETGHAPSAVYFAGKIHEGRVWYLPLAALLIKTPLPALFLALAGFFCVLRQRLALRTKLVLFIFPLLFFAVGMRSHRYEQLRYFLPVFPFAFLMAGSFAASCVRLRRKLMVAALLLWLVIENISIYPHYLAYFNQLIGGPQNGHNYLLDSNLDWGQDLKGLAKFVKDRNIKAIGLAYFGKGAPVYYGIPFLKLPSGFYSILESNPDPYVHFPRRGWIAVSANFLHGVMLPPKQRDLYKPLLSMPYAARIGYSIYVYHFVKNDPAGNETKKLNQVAT